MKLKKIIKNKINSNQKKIKYNIKNNKNKNKINQRQFQLQSFHTSKSKTEENRLNIHAGFLNSSPQKAAGLVLFEREKKKKQYRNIKTE